jgi:outer membrane protein assembly factor BamB
MKKALGDVSLRARTALGLLILLLFSGIATAVSPGGGAVAASSSSSSQPSSPNLSSALTQAEANWASPNGNQYGQDYNPQMQINSSNTQYLGLSWVFPLPARPAPLATYSGQGGLGVDTAPLVVNGTIYAITQFDQVFALNAETGAAIWADILPITLNSTAGTGSPLVLHAHDGIEQWSTSLFNHTPTLWLQAANNKVYAIDALDGAYELNFTDFSGPKTVQGNSPTSFYNDAGQANILLDQSAGILITSHGAESIAANGRCYFTGWNVLADPPAPSWTSYCTPPQPGSGIPVDPNWDISQVKNMSSAEIFSPGLGSTNGYTTPAEVAGGVLLNSHNGIVVQLKDLSPSQLNSTLYNDWGYADQTAQCTAITGGQSTGSTGAGWGGAWLLGSGQTAGMAFVSTNNKDPWVGPCTPGPDLWSASLLALNVTTGAWVWGFQANAHDLWDYDCSWWQGMGNETISGVNTEVIFKTCKNGYLYEINAKTGNLIWAWNPPQSEIPRCPYCYLWNPLNRTQMTQQFFTPNGQPALEYPSDAAGFEDEQAYNPTTNTLFVAAHIVPGFVTYVGLNSSTYFTSTGERVTPVIRGDCYDCNPARNNATIFAINASSGAIEWHYFIPLQGYRGGVTTSGGVVFLTLSSGDLLMLDARTGNQIRDYYIGGPLNVLPSIGATVNGKEEEVIVPITAGTVTWAAGGVPGDLVALALQGTAVATGATTAAVTTTITTTVVSNVSPGIVLDALYVVSAVAVVSIIATGYLIMRRGRPGKKE